MTTLETQSTCINSPGPARPQTSSEPSPTLPTSSTGTSTASADGPPQSVEPATREESSGVTANPEAGELEDEAQQERDSGHRAPSQQRVSKSQGSPSSSPSKPRSATHAVVPSIASTILPTVEMDPPGFPPLVVMHDMNAYRSETTDTVLTAESSDRFAAPSHASLAERLQSSVRDPSLAERLQSLVREWSSSLAGTTSPEPQLASTATSSLPNEVPPVIPTTGPTPSESSTEGVVAMTTLAPPASVPSSRSPPVPLPPPMEPDDDVDAALAVLRHIDPLPHWPTSPLPLLTPLVSLTSPGWVPPPGSAQLPWSYRSMVRMALFICMSTPLNCAC